MLGTYIAAKFAVPENPVMRAVAGAPLLLTAPEQKGITGFGASAPRGMGCGCSSKIPSFGLGAFTPGMGNISDEGLRLYGDWYGAQQHGGMVLNGDGNGLGTYFPSDAHGYRGFSGLGAHRAGGLGDIETLMSNLTSGNFGAALSGNDIASSLPNWIVIFGGWWMISTFVGQVSRTGSRVKKRYKAARSAPRGSKFSAANEAA